MAKYTKLELTWFGKDKEEKIEPRILIEDESLSNTQKDETTENMLIHGDNLLALKALEQDYSGKIKCIYIDPPYNTGSAFEHYDDNLEHSTWLSLMKPRLEILRNLLTDDGVIFVQIDDNEQAYLTVLMDEIFGRKNRVNIICIKMSESSGVKMSHIEKRLPKIKEFVLVYKKTESVLLNPVSIEKENINKYLKYYSKIIINFDDKVENWTIQDVKDYMSSKKISITKESIEKFKLENKHRVIYRTNNKSFEKLEIKEPIKEITSSTGIKYIWWEGKQMLFLADHINEYICDLWTDISTINLNKEGVLDFKQSKKPEKLIKRCIEIGTKPGDIVLDSFLGSGTTSAVAHKMGRKWIGIEMGDHAYTHCKVRLDKVIENEDSGGITSDVNWQGGGGYRFYELAPTLIKEDAFGQAIINPEYSAEMLVSAISKHEGYFYNPDKNVFWKQANNKGNSYLYVTTNHVNDKIIETIKSEMKEDEFCLIVCKSYDQNCNLGKNIAIKKIPQSLLKNCEFGKDNYNLNIISPPEFDYEEDEINE